MKYPEEFLTNIDRLCTIEHHAQFLSEILVHGGQLIIGPQVDEFLITKFTNHFAPR